MTDQLAAFLVGADCPGGTGVSGRLPVRIWRDRVCGISFGYEDAARSANRFRTGRADTDEITEMRRS